MKDKPCHCCHGSGEETSAVAIGHTMRCLRLKKLIGLRVMAERMGISHTFLSLLEQGKRNWTAKLIQDFKDSTYDQTT